ncbi:MAG: cell division protein ZapE [Alphaproteobacteria bacterium]
MTGPIFRYRELKNSGALHEDPIQELAAEKLQSLHHALNGYKHQTGAVGWKERLGLSRRRDDPPQGLYMYGGVGRGKSMLMDLLFETSPIEAKRRVHFHEFMIETHGKIHKWRQAQKDRATKETDPLPKIAAEVADEATVLCFDEFHVTDIADAMILGRLFEALFENGVVVVATSNWAPEDLYKDGLQRDRFLPFIDLLKQRLDVLHLDSETDYRMIRLKGFQAYHSPLGQAASRELEQAFQGLTEGARVEPAVVEVKGRKLTIPEAARGVAKCTFADLCEKPLGAEDYLSIAARYHTMVLDGVPKLSADKRNEAKRFMTLIDALYEARVNLIMAADAAPDELYREGKHAFEFERSVSRLMEMQSTEYREEPHRGAAAEFKK